MNYSSKNKKSNKKFLLLVIAAGVILLVIGIGFFIKSKESAKATKPTISEQSEEINLLPPTKEEIAAVDEAKINDGQTPSGGSVPAKGNPPANNAPVSIVSAKQDGSGNLIVITELAGSSWKNCSLTVVNTERTFTINVSAFYQPQSSSCSGYSINKSELASGATTLSLKATKIDGTENLSEQRTVSIVK